MTLRELRMARSLTLKQVAEAVGVTESAMSLYETGKRHPPVRIAKRLGSFYEIPWSDFYKDIQAQETA